MFWVFALLFLLVFGGALVWYVRFAARQGHTPPERRPPAKMTSRGRKAQERRRKAKRARASSGSYAAGSDYTSFHHVGRSDDTSVSEGAYSSSTDHGGGYDSGGVGFGGGGDFGGGGAGGDFGGGDSGGGGGGGGGGGE
jgi:hypothetical protein